MTPVTDTDDRQAEIDRYLRSNPNATTRQILANVSGADASIRNALRAGLESGRFAVTPGSRGANQYRVAGAGFTMPPTPAPMDRRAAAATPPPPRVQDPAQLAVVQAKEAADRLADRLREDEHRAELAEVQALRTQYRPEPSNPPTSREEAEARIERSARALAFELNRNGTSATHEEVITWGFDADDLPEVVKYARERSLFDELDDGRLAPIESPTR